MSGRLFTIRTPCSAAQRRDVKRLFRQLARSMSIAYRHLQAMSPLREDRR